MTFENTAKGGRAVRELQATADDIESDLGRLTTWNMSTNADETS